MAEMTLEQQVKAGLLAVLDEAFEHHHGIFLDKGCTLFETLEQFDAARASVPVGGQCASVAAHVAHMTFYLDVARRYMTGEELGKLDWMEIWRTVREVTPERWSELKADLRRAHGDLLAMLQSDQAWGDENTWAGVMGITAHTAYHLGAIRQVLCAAK
jgi:hypothetical protein